MSRTHLHHVWDYTDVDRRFWEEHLADWVPDKIIDAHRHVGDSALRTVPITEEKKHQYWVNEVSEPVRADVAARCDDIIFQGRCETTVTMGSPSLDYDLEAVNDYVCQESNERGWPALVVSPPSWSQERVAKELSRPGVIGLKPYYSLIGPSDKTRDAHIQADIFDYLPHHILEVADERGAWITLHVPKKERLPHPANIRQIKEIRQKYPNITLVIAHLGRCYTEPHAREGLPPLADDPGLYFDNSAVFNPAVHRLALELLGPERILYGTDNPVFYMRGHRQWKGRTYVNRTNYPFYFNKEREAPEIEAKYTIFVYEGLRTLKEVFENLGMGPERVKAVLHDNAARLIRKVKEAVSE